jgi:hypothetical protein
LTTVTDHRPMPREDPPARTRAGPPGPAGVPGTGASTPPRAPPRGDPGRADADLTVSFRSRPGGSGPASRRKGAQRRPPDGKTYWSAPVAGSCRRQRGGGYHP